MDQGSRLKRLPGRFLHQLLGSQLAKFGIDQGQKLFRGLRFSRRGSLEVVDVAEAGEESLVVHDAHTADPSYAFALSRLATEDLRYTPIGVFRSVERPSYDDLMAEQLDRAERCEGPTAFDWVVGIIERHPDWLSLRLE